MDSASISFVSSAPGKLILAGEHSVVHFTRALASVIDKRTFAQFTYQQTKKEEQEDETVELKIVTRTLNEHYTWRRSQLLEVYNQLPTPPPTAFEQLLPYLDETLKPALINIPYAASLAAGGAKVNPTPTVFLLYYFAVLRCPIGSLAVTIESQLPIGAGLGSSASFTATLSSGFVWLALQLQKTSSTPAAGDYLGTSSCSCANSPSDYIIPSSGAAGPATIQPCLHMKDAINSWSYEGERIIHGNPSGLDNTTCVHGGVVLYRKTRPAQGDEPSVPGLMRPLTDIPTLTLLVVNTRVPRDTAKLVAGVGERKKADPVGVNAMFDEIEHLVGEWLTILQPSSSSSPTSDAPLSVADRETRVGELMTRNQELLDAMGVGHDIITKVLTAAKTNGYPGKLTGAGGGGCIIILIPTPSNTTDSSASSSSSFSNFTRELESLGCEYLSTVVGQAGVWIRTETTLKDTAELH